MNAFKIPQKKAACFLSFLWDDLSENTGNPDLLFLQIYFIFLLQLNLIHLQHWELFVNTSKNQKVREVSLTV